VRTPVDIESANLGDERRRLDLVVVPPLNPQFADVWRLLTFDEVAEALRCSRRTVERRIATGELEVVRVGRRVLVTLRSLRAFLESHACVESGRSYGSPKRAARRRRRLWQ
jgi:excisionase family DNA binding protein